MPLNDGLIAPYANTLELTGGTMTGPIAMGSNKITGLAAGTAATDAAQIQQSYFGQQEIYLNGSPTFMRANMPRNVAVANLSALSTGVMTSVAILLFAGDTVTNLTFVSGGTALGTGTHWWFALYDTATTPNLLAQTADQTSTAWAANTAKTVALASPYAVTTTGIYYAAINVTATTPPTLAGSSVQAGVAGAVITGMKVLAQTSGSSLAATAPSTIASPTTVGTVPYVIAN